MLYFFMFIIFLCLIIGPIVASKFLKSLPSLPMNLLQPTGQDNNDTSSVITGGGINLPIGAANSAAATTASTTG
jgi:1,3-beta-glucan synthase